MVCAQGQCAYLSWEWPWGSQVPGNHWHQKCSVCGYVLSLVSLAMHHKRSWSTDIVVLVFSGGEIRTIVLAFRKLAQKSIDNSCCVLTLQSSKTSIVEYAESSQEYSKNILFHLPFSNSFNIHQGYQRKSWPWRFNFSVFLTLVSIEKIYQTLKTVFDHISKHRKGRQELSAARRIFNSLLAVWKCDQTRSFRV